MTREVPPWLLLQLLLLLAVLLLAVLPHLQLVLLRCMRSGPPANPSYPLRRALKATSTSLKR